MTEVSIPFITKEGNREETRTLLAEADEAARSALWRAIVPDTQKRAAIGAHPLFIIAVPDESIRLGVFERHIEIPDDATVHDLLTALDGDPLQVTHGGWGGDALWAEPILNLWELLNAGLTIGGAYSAVKASQRGLTRIRYRKHDALASEWIEDGKPQPVPMELLRLVKEQNPWRRRHFDFVFRLDETSAVDLLRASGYRRSRGTGVGAEWTDQSESDVRGKEYYFDPS